MPTKGSPMKRTLVLALLVCASGVAAADAKVPRYGTKTIVPGQSIGGVKIGMTKAQAVAVWRSPDRCVAGGPGQPTWCQYLALSTLQGGSKLINPFSGFYLRAGRVVAVNVESAENVKVDPVVKRLKTNKGIHIHSTMAALKRAHGVGPVSGGEAGKSRAVIRSRGKRCTQFYAPDFPYTRIDSIVVGICGVAGLPQ